MCGLFGQVRGGSLVESRYVGHEDSGCTPAAPATRVEATRPELEFDSSHLLSQGRKGVW